MTFKSWLKKSKYIKENNPIGDLARDILSDTDFPNTIEKHIMYKYLFFNAGDKNCDYFEIMYSDFIRFISRTYSDEI